MAFLDDFGSMFIPKKKKAAKQDGVQMRDVVVGGAEVNQIDLPPRTEVITEADALPQAKPEKKLSLKQQQE